MKWSFIPKLQHTRSNVKKFYTAVFMGIVFLPASAISADAPYVTSMSCEIAGCSIKCLNKSQEWLTLTEKAQSVVMTTHESGVVNFAVNKGVHGKETFIVGPNSFLCKIEGQK